MVEVAKSDIEIGRTQKESGNLTSDIMSPGSQGHGDRQGLGGSTRPKDARLMLCNMEILAALECGLMVLGRR